MHDDTDYISAGLACILLVGVLFVKIVLLMKPAPELDYSKLSIMNNNYNQEIFLDGKEAKKKN